MHQLTIKPADAEAPSRENDQPDTKRPKLDDEPAPVLADSFETEGQVELAKLKGKEDVNDSIPPSAPSSRISSELPLRASFLSTSRQQSRRRNTPSHSILSSNSQSPRFSARKVYWFRPH